MALEDGGAENEGDKQPIGAERFGGLALSGDGVTDPDKYVDRSKARISLGLSMALGDMAAADGIGYDIGPRGEEEPALRIKNDGSLGGPEATTPYPIAA